MNQEKHQTYLDAFPGLDLMAEYKRMDAWLESNPKKRKTDRGYPRFVNNWLGKAFKDMMEGSKSFWDDLPKL